MTNYKDILTKTKTNRGNSATSFQYVVWLKTVNIKSEGNLGSHTAL